MIHQNQLIREFFSNSLKMIMKIDDIIIN